MKIQPILENVFYHDGRGPELQKVIWKQNGVILAGFEYYNPDNKYDSINLKYLKLENVQVFSMASEEVHASILASGDTNAAIFKVLNSTWKKEYHPTHLKKCSHYQIMFYDEIYDVICEAISSGNGPYPSVK